MVAFNLSHLHKSYALPLIGITAHVYADTFSHYGFSGISSRKNKIINDSFTFEEINPDMETYIRKKEALFKENYPNENIMLNIKSWIAEKISGALGHAAAVTFPDRPFLQWSFQYEWAKQRCSLRNNPKTYLEACEKLHGIFKTVAKKRQDLVEENSFKDFNLIRDIVSSVLRTQADQEGRIKAWEDVVLKGNIIGTGAEEIPAYNKDTWPNQRDNLKREKDSSVTTSLSIYQFYQAAAIHRINVLRNILPSHGLMVA